MDSDTPDLAALQDLCREFNATLLVDVAHDLGCIGEDGGFIAQHEMLGKIDIVMGSFSKTFASNGGFVSCNSAAVRQYLKFYGCSAIFSNALSPVQAATVLKAFEIVQSDRGRQLRQKLMDRILLLREKLIATGLGLIGMPSPIVPVVVGDEALARLVSRELPQRGIVANMVEFPAVAKGNARFRLQVMPSHSHEQIVAFVERFAAAIDAACDLTFICVFGSFFYGGVSSPFLPWFLTALLLGFFYFGDRPMLVLGIFAANLAGFCLSYFLNGGSHAGPRRGALQGRHHFCLRGDRLHFHDGHLLRHGHHRAIRPEA